MTCERLLVPTKRGSCSLPQPRSHTALEMGSPNPAGPPAALSTPSSSSQGEGREENISPRYPTGSVLLVCMPELLGMDLQTLLQGHRQL